MELDKGILDLVQLQFTVAFAGVVTGIDVVESDSGGEVVTGFEEVAQLHESVPSGGVELGGALVGRLDGTACGTDGFREELDGSFDVLGGFGVLPHDLPS
jgi:hypothetical protein